MKTVQTVYIPQVYYWDVEFVDGYHLRQFSTFGGERMIKNLCDNTESRKGGNFFHRYEQKHGRVVKMVLYPFNKKLSFLAKLRQWHLKIIHDRKLQPLKVDVPEWSYLSFFKTNAIEYGINNQTPATGTLSSYTITLHNRSNPDNFTITELKLNMV